MTTTRTLTATLSSGTSRDPEDVTTAYIADCLVQDDDELLDSDWTDV